MSASISVGAETDSFQPTSTYINIPAAVADMIPSGIDFRGLARSPDRPTPAVMPVNAGNTMANTTMNGSFSRSSLNRIGAWSSLPGTAWPSRKATNDTASTPTTTHRAATPMLAPLVSMSPSSSTMAGSEIIRGSNGIPIVDSINGASDRNASANAIR